jgi:uncharacterized protein
MRIVVLADTHVPGYAKDLPRALLPALRRADLILHAGDVDRAFVLDQLKEYAPVRVALGNNDHADVARWGAAEEVRLDLEAVVVAMVHDSGPRSGRETRLRRRFPDAHVVVFGHSHIPWNAISPNGQLLFNPGSPTWKRRQPLPTYGVLTISAGRARGRIVELRR